MHDINSPSVLYRRYLCPGSAKMEAAVQKESGEEGAASEAALTGIRLHKEINEIIQGKPITDYPPEDFGQLNICLEKIDQVKKSLAIVDGVDGVSVYDYKVDLSLMGIENPGTIDYGIMSVTNDMAVIIDFKFGSQYVPAPKYNWQVKAYCAGIHNYFGIRRIYGAIIQPNEREERQLMINEFTANEIEEFKIQIKGIVDRTKEESPLLVVGDRQCQFCRAKEMCPARQNCALQVPMHLVVSGFLQSIEPTARADFYEKVLTLQKWADEAVNKTDEFILNNPDGVPGWTIADGRKTRIWGSKEEAESKLRQVFVDSGKDPNSLLKTELISPAEAEKIIGKSKSAKQVLDALVVFKEGNKRIVRAL